MARRIMIAGAPNYVPQLALQTPATTAAGMGVAQLATDEPSERMRITSLNIENSYIQAYTVAIADAPWVGGTPVDDVFALINHNLTEGEAKYRILYNSTAGAINPHARVAPNSVQVNTNISGVVTNIDENPYSPDANMMEAVSMGVATTLRVRFPTPGVALRTGADKQAFRGLIQMNPGETGPRTATMKLYQNASFLASLGSVVFFGSGLVILHGFWDASSLSGAANVECQIECDGAMDVEAIDWLQETTTLTYLHDSGWLTVPTPGDTTLWSGSRIPGPLPAKHLFYLPPSAQTAANRLIMIRDVENADGYIQAGCLVASGAFFPSVLNFSHGPLVSVRDPSPSQFTLGGQEVGGRRAPRRVMPINLSQVTSSEGWSLFDRLDWLKGKKAPFLVVKFPDDSASYRHTALWGTLEEMPGLALLKPLDRMSWSGVFVEKL